ncbi:PTS sugar transporter subunit IIA [Candidimonas nitroreducens]|uniref:PTS sugar transporter subunit IIA n=1 Tax=Candidimonas nitroreducens TaxID=683354 RepID=A0A225LZ91_9BURK|nr:PTS sugar transporter subunit IIA [Candidimonas nitroreducens]OWT54487.1 PTS sugar transporter subunit IIA [Candidimonas nitroreducens]
MASIVLVMHAPLATAFAECARHVLGSPPALQVFDVHPDDNPDELVPRLAGMLARARSAGEETLILCDIYGATPFNIAKRALAHEAQQGGQSRLLTGTNLCMVLKALTEKQKMPEQLSQLARQGALKGIVDTGPADTVDDACT